MLTPVDLLLISIALKRYREDMTALKVNFGDDTQSAQLIKHRIGELTNVLGKVEAAYRESQ